MKNLLIIIILLASGLLFAQTITPIANIQDSLDVYDGQVVTIQGVVTIGDGLLYSGKTQFYIQDNSGRGIQLFDHTPLSTVYVKGDLIEVTGEVGLYTGSSGQYYNVQITDPDVTLISQINNLPYPHSASGSEDTTLNGTWASAIGQINSIWDSPYGFYQITIDVDGFDMDLQFWDSTGANVEEYIEGDVIIAHGIIAFYEGTPQLSCAYEEDMNYYTDTDNYPYGDIGEVIADEPVNITFTYPLDFDSVILNWKTNSDSDFNLLEMVPTENNENIYEGDVPAHGEGTIVQFYITASDTSGLGYIFPEEFPQAIYSYTYNVTTHRAILNIPAKAFDPYSGETFPIEFGAEYDDRAILRIYNAEGKLKKTLINTIIENSNGISYCTWNGKDRENNLVPLGLYICYLEVTDVNTGRKKTAKAPIVIGSQLK